MVAYELWGAGAFLVAIGLALFVRSARRKRRDGEHEAPAPRGPMACPTCGRESPSGTLFCPVDARRLVPAESAGERRASVHCPRCRRAFDAGSRFCPFDAEDLQAWAAEHEHTHGDGEDDAGKICPVCAAKYGIEATFCGKDGSELMTVN